ncbi:glutamyl-tRNA reductase [Methanobacterium alcaliphilum]|uniref:glutamyl-tRNA reductase n=1 Tax=Methanobacterium alcaliphilum TaxID=392018 RepID=UPI00200A2432|nr:glutamyl-tRNA reductase [Methanobacterium alcaliphilum]MCK9150374.1 glutamyl-tRNA reductase [Methanobacterium alcaliphilum]
MILNIRVDHKTADIKTMESSISTLDDLFLNLKSKCNVEEYISLRTCNRSEYYMVLSDNYLGEIECADFVIEKNEAAMMHLLRLASGLESMIIGEDQILGQIKDAKKKAKKEGSAGIVLDTIFNKAIHVGQSVRKKTQINRGSVSIGSAAVNLAESVHGNLKCKKVLIVGAGKMGTLVAKALVEKHLKAIVVANRTHDRAVCLAKELGGYAIHFDRLKESMEDADVIISATGAPHAILTYEKVKAAVPLERRNSLVMVDIANPRDIEDEVSNLGVKVFNIDDLRGIAEDNRKIRKKEAKEAEKIVENELLLLNRSLKHLKVEPLLSDIRSNMELIRYRETQKALKKLGNINGKEKVVDKLTKSVVDKIFHDIVLNLRKAAENDEEELIKACELLFNNEN